MEECIRCKELEQQLAEQSALYDKAFSESGGLLHRKQLVRMLDARDAELAALKQRIHDASEVYAGMEGMNPSTHAEQYLLLLLGQMYEALQEKGE